MLRLGQLQLVKKKTTQAQLSSLTHSEPGIFLKIRCSSFLLQFYLNYRKNMKQKFCSRKTINQQHTQPSNQPALHTLPGFALDILAFERICAPPTTSAIYLNKLLKLSILVHSLVGYLVLGSCPVCQAASGAVESLRSQRAVVVTVQICLYLLNLFMLGSVCIYKGKQADKIKLSILKQVIGNYSLLAQTNLTLTFFLALINLLQNLPLILLATTLALFHTLFLENYSLRNQINYQASPVSALIWQVGVILLFTANAAIIHYGTLIFYLQSTAFFGLLALLWYLITGYKQYFHKTSTLIEIFFCSAIISMGAQFGIAAYRGQLTVDFIQWGIAFAIIAFALSSHCESRKERIQHITKIKELKQYELAMRYLLQESNCHLEIESIVVGILANHCSQACLNPKCKIMQLSNQMSSQKDCVGSLLLKQKHQLLLNYVRCLYYTSVKTDKTTQSMLDYCEFMISEFCNISTHCFYLEQLLLNQHSLSLLQKIKVNKLKLILMEQSETINKFLFGGRIEFLSVLECDYHFDYIIANISSYCSRSALIWKMALQKTINVSDWKYHIQQNFNLLPAIDEHWKYLSKYFYVNKLWRFIYLNYAYYLKNETIKNRQLQADDSESNQLALFNYASKTSYFKDGLFFDDQTCLFQAKMQAGQLLFKRVSKNFEKLTHYSEQEIVNMPLTTIQPYEIRVNHCARVNAVLQNGSTPKEEAYHVLDTYFVNKQGEKVKAIVLFKFCISSISADCIIRFVCLLSAIQTEEKFTSSDLSFEPKSTKQEIRAPTEQNIFVKEEALQPTQNYAQLKKIVLMTRIVMLLVFVSMVALFLLFSKESSSSQTLISHQGFMLAAYRYPMSIAINYIKQFLNISDPALVNTKIRGSTFQLLQLSNDPKMISILSDQSINSPALYSPHMVLPANQGLAYDQVDIFYVIYSCMVTLSNSSKINRTSSEYMRLDSYLMQYNRMTNSTKTQLHNRFTNLIHETQRYQLISIFFAAGLFLLAALYLAHALYLYCTNINELATIILQFDHSIILENQQYWRTLAVIFSRLSVRHPHNLTYVVKDSLGFASTQALALENELQIEDKSAETPLNQRSKNILVSAQEKKQTCNFILCLVLMIGLLFCVTVVVPVFNLTQLQKIKSFQSTGFDIFRHLSFTGQLSYAVSRTYHYNLYPNQIALAPQLFSNTLTILDLMGQYEYVEVGQIESNFFLARKNYLFGNPCTYNATVLSINNATMQNCLTLSNGSMTAGLCAYLRNVQSTMNNFIKGKIKLTLAQVNTLSSGMAIASYYFYDLGYSWMNELTQLLTTFANQELYLTLLTLLAWFAVYYVGVEMRLMSKLRENYQLMKNLYGAYVPEAILLREKVIKQKFCQTGIIA